MPPDEPNDEEKLEMEQEDGETPFRPADDADQDVVDTDADEPLPAVSEESSIPSSERGGISSTFPQTDANMIAAEWYDEGISGAAGASEPNVGNTVVGYHGKGTRPAPPDNDVPDGFHEEDEDKVE